MRRVLATSRSPMPSSERIGRIARVPNLKPTSMRITRRWGGRRRSGWRVGGYSGWRIRTAPVEAVLVGPSCHTHRTCPLGTRSIPAIVTGMPPAAGPA